MDDRETLEGGHLLTEVSNTMVALHRLHFGRGPGAAKSVLVDDLLVCTLTDVYTPVERTLIRSGDLDRVRETRLVHQLALREEFEVRIEKLTGRPVHAYVSGVHFDPDMAVELFYLEPDADEPHPRGSS